MKLTRIVCDFRWLAGTVAGGCALALACYGWHAYQFSRLSESLLSRADRLESAGDVEAATGYVQRYISLRRGTPAAQRAQVRLAKLIDRSTGSSEDYQDRSRAVSAFYQALGAATAAEESPLRQRLVELLIESQRFDEAERESVQLLQSDAGNPAAQRAYAIALAGQVRRGELVGKRPQPVFVGNELLRALELNPGDIRLSWLTARMYRESPSLLNDSARSKLKSDEDRGRKADAILDEMVRLRADDPDAWLTRFKYRTSFKLAGAEDDLRTAVEKGPDSLEVRLTAAFQAHGSSDPAVRKSAIDHYRYILTQLHPRSEAAWLGLGDVYLVEQVWDRATETYQAGLQALGADHFALNERLALTLLQAGRLEEAEQRMERLDRIVAGISFGNPGLRREREQDRDLFRARLWLEMGTSRSQPQLVRRAVDLLERLVNGPSGKRADAWNMLGSGYRALQRWDAAANAYDKAYGVDAARLDHRSMAAAAWLAAGQPDQAVRRYEELLATPSSADNIELWIALATARLQQQMRRGVELRQWAGCDAALTKADDLARRDGYRDRWKISLLRAERLLISRDGAASSVEKGRPSDDAADDAADARASELARSLSECEQSPPDDPEFWERLIGIYQRLGDEPSADRALARLEALAGPSRSSVLAKARLQIRRERFADAEATLVEGLARLPASVHADLRRELVRLAYAQGEVEPVRARLRELERELQCDPETLFQLAELAFHENDDADARHWEARLRECEGPHGALSQFVQARRLIWAAESDNDPNLAEAERRIAAIVVARPHWPAPYVLKGFLAERRGQPQDAVAAYRKALEGGDRRPVLFQRLVHLLRDNLPEVERLLGMMHDPGTGLTSLAELRISLAERRGDLEGALVLARAEAAQRPNDPLIQFWLGRVLLNRYDSASPQAETIREEAFRAFTKAQELDPDNPQTWSGLFLFCLKTRQLDEARRKLDGIDGLTQLSPGRRAELRAQGLQLLDDRTAAQAQYVEALKLEPANAEFHLRYAALMQSANAELAASHLREALRLNPKLDAARRLLAGLLVRDGGETEWRQAQELLESPDDRSGSDANERLQALLLVQRQGAENLNRARVILERLVASTSVQPGDRLLLARLYEMENDHPSALGQYLALVARENPAPTHVVEFVDFLMRREKWGDVGKWLAKLDAVAPLSLATLQIRVRLLQRTDRLAELDATLDDYFQRVQATATDPLQKGRLLRAIGDLCGGVGRHEAAEKWHRQAYAISPQHFAGLALSLARQGRKPEALQICLAVAESDSSPKPAIVACELLLLGPSTRVDFQTAEPLIARALAAHGSDVVLLSSTANVRFFENRGDEAYALFKKVVQADPRNVVVLNNLATLLGERPERSAEALSYIDRAIDIAGPQPALLDTKGTILLLMGKAEQALPLFDAAAKTINPDPRFKFHLALAYHQTGRTAKSRQILDQARQTGLDQQVLTESDRKMWQELERALAGADNS